MNVKYFNYLFVFLLIIPIIKCEEYTDYDNREKSNDIRDNNTANQAYDDDSDGEDVCNLETVLEKYIEIITPEDYEESMAMDMHTKFTKWNQTFNLIIRYNKYVKAIIEKMGYFTKPFSPRMTEMILSVDLPTDCMESFARISSAAKQFKGWGLKFMDSQPSLGSGMSGFPIGAYDQCLNIESFETDFPIIKGQYCFLTFPNLLPPKDSIKSGDSVDDYLKKMFDGINALAEEGEQTSEQTKVEITSEILRNGLKMNDFLMRQDIAIPTGLCIPTNCNPKDVEYAINKIVYPITRIPMAFHGQCDYLGKNITLSDQQIIAVTIFSILFILAVFSTIYEIIYNRNHKNVDEKDESNGVIIGKSFSVISNFKELMNLKVFNNKFGCVDGLRAIFSFWVLMAHTFQMGLLPLHTKSMESSASYKILTDDAYLLYKNWHTIDVFFLLGGMMTCYVMLSKLEQSKGKFNYFEYALFRYLRLLPFISGAILLIFIFPLVGDGPFWKMFTQFITEPCTREWKTALMMTNNYEVEMPEKLMCNPATWYTSSDFQLHLIAPFVFLVYQYSQRFGLIWNILLILIGIFLAVAPKLVFDIPSIVELLHHPRSQFVYNEIQKHHYYGVEAHFSIYMIGILIGYLIRTKPNLYFGGKYGEFCIWIITVSLTVGGVYTCRYIYNPFFKLNQVEVYLWIVLPKFMHIAGWSWLIYACATGRGGFVNKFLSWIGFRLFSKLSFEVYILHTMTLAYRVGTARQHYFYSNFYFWSIIPFDYLVTVLMAVPFYLLISSPSMNLMKLLMKKPQNTKKEKGDMESIAVK